MKKKVIISIIGTVVVIATSILGYNIKKGFYKEENAVQDQVASVSEKDKEINDKIESNEVENEVNEIEEKESVNNKVTNEMTKSKKNEKKNKNTNKKSEEKRTENKNNKDQEKSSNNVVVEEKYQDNSSNEYNQENSEEECEYQENFSNENEDDLNKFTLYEIDLGIPVCSGYSVTTRYVDVDLYNKTATLKEHVNILDNSEEDDYDVVIKVRNLSDSEAESLGAIYYQMVVINKESSSDFVKQMIGIDDGWDYDNETWEEYQERITVYSTSYKGEIYYIYGVNWIRILSYLFEE